MLCYHIINYIHLIMYMIIKNKTTLWEMIKTSHSLSSFVASSPYHVIFDFVVWTQFDIHQHISFFSLTVSCISNFAYLNFGTTLHCSSYLRGILNCNNSKFMNENNSDLLFHYKEEYHEKENILNIEIFNIKNKNSFSIWFFCF